MTLGRRCTNVIDMFCVGWDLFIYIEWRNAVTIGWNIWGRFSNKNAHFFLIFLKVK